MFSIGDKVVLVNDKWSKSTLADSTCLPVKGKTYVVRGIYIGKKYDEWKMDCRIVKAEFIHLAGMISRVRGHEREAGFLSERFRKLDEIQKQNAEKEYAGVAIEADFRLPEEIRKLGRV